jgi:restriction system protein
MDTLAATTAHDLDDQEAEQPRASRIERHTRDFILDVLSNRISPRNFEELSADLLRVIGYQARVTQYSQDGGVDVIAHKDPLGIEPPLIKAQCKQKVSTVGSPEVNQLVGTQGQGELCLFFTLGGYSKDAQAIERQRTGIRLLSGEDIVSLVVDNYDRLPEHWRRIIPLTPVLVVSDGAE